MAGGQSGSELVTAGLYLHVPFCQAICQYCNFNRGLIDAALKRRYVDALEREVRDDLEYRPAAAVRDRAVVDLEVDTIFFGGGTPSLLEPEEVERLIGACARAARLDPDVEITLEVNPETVTAPRLDSFRRAGVTRLSFGVQSFDDAELARLGRLHSADRARSAVRMARAAGFDDLSLDLMFWLPGQSLGSWLRSIEEAIALGPDHLSMYLLELYPNAPLKEALARGVTDPQAADDEAADMYLRALDRLDAAGFDQYRDLECRAPGPSQSPQSEVLAGGELARVRLRRSLHRRRCPLEERRRDRRVHRARRGRGLARRGRARAHLQRATGRAPVHGTPAFGRGQPRRNRGGLRH